MTVPETPGCLGCDPWLGMRQVRMVRCAHCDPDGDLYEPDPNYLDGLRPTAKGRERLDRLFPPRPPMTEAERRELFEACRLLGEHAARVADEICRKSVREG